MSWYLDNNNQLNHADLAVGIEGDIFTSPYPSSFWNFISSTDTTLTLNDEYHAYMLYPIVDESSGRDDNNILTSPYPASFWQVMPNGEIDMSILPRAVPGDILEPIYPASLWWYNAEQGCLWMYLQGDPLPLGAFANCRHLEYMKIPENVKSLGEETFKKTNLIEVTIADDCTYSSETFPPGCQVKYYSD